MVIIVYTLMQNYGFLVLTYSLSHKWTSGHGKTMRKKDKNLHIVHVTE